MTLGASAVTLRHSIAAYCQHQDPKKTQNKKHHKQKQADWTADILQVPAHPHRSSSTAFLRHPHSPEQSLVSGEALGVSPRRKPGCGGLHSRLVSKRMFAYKPPTAHCLLNVVWGVRVSIYFEPQMIFHVWKTAANYFTNQGKQNHVNSQVLSRIKNVYFPHDR